MTPEAVVIETLFNIPNKMGLQVDFRLNESQKAYDQVRTERDIISKARQKGFSSYGIALQVVDCLGKEGARCVLISHEAKATERLLDKARYYINHIKGPKPELGRKSRNEFYFPKTESTLYIGTAGAKSFGRGDTITHLHISEYAWWEGNALRQVAGLWQAVPLGGTIRIESTSNGRNNDYYKMCMTAEELGYNIFFRSWFADAEYQRPAPEQGWVPEGFEHYFQDMQSKYKLAEEQLFWYWMKLLEFRKDLSLMQQEYPSTMEESFRATGGSVFPDITRVKTEYWKWKVDAGKRIEYLEGHPRSERTYVIGADPSGGTGNDETAVQIICIETLEQVYEFASNRMDPVELAYFIDKIGRLYNEAYVVPEGNNHGIATIAVLVKIYPRQKIYKRHIPSKTGKVLYGWMNTEGSKKGLCGDIKQLDDMGLSVYGEKTYKQLMSFEETEDGKLGAPEDDLVIALGLSCLGVLKWQSRAFDISPPAKLEKEDINRNYMYYTFDEVMDNLQGRQKVKGFPRMIH